MRTTCARMWFVVIVVRCGWLVPFCSVRRVVLRFVWAACLIVVVLFWFISLSVWGDVEVGRFMYRYMDAVSVEV